jgi:uncharacterized protein (TIGR00251 family)
MGRISVRAVPGSSRNGVAGWLGDALKVRVSAPAERGKANAAVERVLAEALGVSDDSVHVVAGRASRNKIVEIVGLSESEIRRRLRP